MIYMNNTETTTSAYAARTDAHISESHQAVANAERALMIATGELDRKAKLYEGWSRFYLVRNNGGHIHSSMNCSTCFITTQFSWITELSGKTEAEAVELLGEILCSVCFPTAPVEWTNGISNEAKANRTEAAEQAEERKAAAEAKAERKAAAEAKAEQASAEAQAALAAGTVKLNPTISKLVAAHDDVEVGDFRTSSYSEDSDKVLVDVFFQGKLVCTVIQKTDGKVIEAGRMRFNPGGGGQSQHGKTNDVKAWVAEQVEDLPGKSNLDHAANM